MKFGALISQSQALCDGIADYIKLEGSAYRRRFAPLISADVRLGYFVCIDTNGNLQNIPANIWQIVDQILAKLRDFVLLPYLQQIVKNGC